MVPIVEKIFFFCSYLESQAISPMTTATIMMRRRMRNSFFRLALFLYCSACLNCSAPSRILEEEETSSKVAPRLDIFQHYFFHSVPDAGGLDILFNRIHEGALIVNHGCEVLENRVDVKDVRLELMNETFPLLK